MLDHRRLCEEGPDDGAPLGKQRALAKVHRVVFQALPEDLQDVALLALDAAGTSVQGVAKPRAATPLTGIGVAPPSQAAPS